MKAGNILPRIPKNDPQGRTEFESLTEFFQYAIDEDNRMKKQKKENILKISESKASEGE